MTDPAFHAVEWTRKVRDQMYAATSTLSAEGLIQFVRQAAAASDSGVRVAESEVSAPLLLHEGAQHSVHARLIARAGVPEPVDHVRVKPD